MAGYCTGQKEQHCQHVWMPQLILRHAPEIPYIMLELCTSTAGA